MRIDITECDHDSLAIEQSVADSYGFTLNIHQSRSSEELIANCAGADAIVVQYAPITAEVMDQLPGLRAIGRYGVGVDTIDVEAATERGIAVCSVPDYGTEAVSDHAIALALASLREVARADRAVRAGESAFPEIRPIPLITNLTFGVIGAGLIGSAAARKAAGLGMKVIGADPAASPHEKTYNNVEIVPLPELLAQADIISVHTPLNAETRHLLSTEEFAQMKDSVVVVNTSRGGVIDTQALIAALDSGKVRATALDVFETEPLPADHPLTAYPNATLTPHVAWYTEDSYAELKRRVVENVAEILQGRTPRNILNPSVLQ